MRAAGGGVGVGDGVGDGVGEGGSVAVGDGPGVMVGVGGTALGREQAESVVNKTKIINNFLAVKVEIASAENHRLVMTETNPNFRIATLYFLCKGVSMF
jgi:hypothetical protein